MKTFIAFLIAIWLVGIHVLIAGAFRTPWSGIQPALPFIILISLVGTMHSSLRFAAFVGVLESMVFPGYGLAILPVFLLVAAASGPLFRLMFTAPTIGSLAAAAVGGTLLYEAGTSIMSAGLWYETGAPDAGTWLTGVVVRFSITLITLILAGELYRRIFLRFRQAFLGVSSIV
jgi:hypothetical protein